jgi:casein kinase 1 alpha
MELLGSDLDDLFIRSSLKRFSLKTSLMIGLHVLDRLEVLHGLGYIHRDIKPDNLAVGIRDLSRRVYLIDFGLSKKLNFQEK